MKYSLRMTQQQYDALKNHLFPGDGLEAAAFMLCGRRKGTERYIFTVHKIVTIPYSLCSRHVDKITWPTDVIDGFLKEAYKNGYAIIKIHSHTSNFHQFSALDDISDKEIFSALTDLLPQSPPHMSTIMLPTGEIFGRILNNNGERVDDVGLIMVVGPDLQIWTKSLSSSVKSFALRTAQSFGKGTTNLLHNLSIAVVGCSGTGSIVVEQLARLGVGRLVLVDPDKVEDKNLNRILNSSKCDSFFKRFKVNVLKKAISKFGFNQKVLPLRKNLITPEVVLRVAECDVVFGCVDSVDGRHMLNRLCTFYTLPYFDVGVRLRADGTGGIDEISGAVHYLQPGLSSLLSRGVYTMKAVEAEEQLHTDPAMYKQHLKEGYIRGVHEDSPAVISVNMLYASLVVNDFLARIHPYRNQPNNDYSCIRCNLSDLQFHHEKEEKPCDVLKKHVGRGDVLPLLERTIFS